MKKNPHTSSLPHKVVQALKLAQPSWYTITNPVVPWLSTNYGNSLHNVNFDL